MAFLPVGSLEQHGPHLPLGTDGIIAEALAGRLADIFAPAYLLPLLPFSSSFEHAGFPGSVSLKVTTIASVISDVVESLAFSGIGKLVIVSCHMGNHLLRNVVQELNYPRPRVLLLPSRHHWEGAYRAAGLSSSPSRDMHAGEGETSIIMHLFPEAVRYREMKDVDRPERQLLEALGMKAYTETGVIGFPSKASAEKGAMLLNALAEETAKTVKEFVEIG
jgi:creatinine amidohydrolase